MKSKKTTAEIGRCFPFPILFQHTALQVWKITISRLPNVYWAFMQYWAFGLSHLLQVKTDLGIAGFRSQRS